MLPPHGVLASPLWGRAFCWRKDLGRGVGTAQAQPRPSSQGVSTPVNVPNSRRHGPQSQAPWRAMQLCTFHTPMLMVAWTIMLLDCRWPSKIRRPSSWPHAYPYQSGMTLLVSFWNGTGVIGNQIKSQTGAWSQMSQNPEEHRFQSIFFQSVNFSPHLQTQYLHTSLMRYNYSDWSCYFPWRSVQL